MKILQRMTSLLVFLVGCTVCFDCAGSGEPHAQDKLVIKYEKWKKAVSNPKDAKGVFAFFYNNPHYPLFEKSVRIAEKYANKNVPKGMALKWFKRYSPKTKEGLELYIRYLLEEQPEYAKNYIKQTWVFQNLSPKFMNKYKFKFANYVSPVEDAKKTKRLMKNMKVKQLEVLKDIVIDEIADFISDFLEKHVVNKSGGYSKQELEDIDRKYSIIQNLIDKKQDEQAANILTLSNKNEEKYATSFFNQRRHIAFNVLRSGKPELAYNVMKMYRLSNRTPNEKIAKAEWLLGYIAFRFLNDLKKAEIHFRKAYDNSLNSIRISKNAFWLAGVYQRRKDVVLAIDWYKKASKYFSTFYGYLAEKRLRQLERNRTTETLSDEFRHEQTFPSGEAFTFYNRELVQVLLKINDKEMRKYFYQQLIYEIEDPNEEMLLMDIAIAHDEMDILISESSKRQHYFSNELAYQILSKNDMKYVKKVNPAPCFISYVHAIIQRESNFNANAKSHAGAIGLMQIMPATARYEAKRIKFYTGASLFNKQKNITLGSSILNRLLKKYSGNLIYATAAYNCGEGNVLKYQKSIKNLKNLAPLDVIELIPIKETRIYVKHVIRALFTYQKKFFASKCYNCMDILNYVK